MEKETEKTKKGIQQTKGYTYTENELKKMLRKLRHPAEIPLTVLSVIITLIIFAGLSYGAIFVRANGAAISFLTKHTGIKEKMLSTILSIGGDGVIILLVVLIIRIIYANLTFLGKVVSQEMRASDSVYSDICQYYRNRAEELGIKNLPQLFFTTSDYKTELLGVEIRGKNAITVDKAAVVKAEKSDDWLDVEYTICRRVARIFLGHYDLWFQLATFAGRLIPAYRELFSRAMTYSTDRVVQKIMGDEDALKAIFTSSYDIDRYREDIEISEIIENKVKDYSKAERLSKFGANLMSDKPIMPYRLQALIDKDKPGQLL